MAVFTAVVLTMPWWLAPLGAGYPDLLQRFAIYGIFAIGFNILFGLTGYLSFGHAAFLGVGSYATMWSFKLLTMNALPAIVFAVVLSGVAALVIGYHQPAALGHLLLDPDARLRADVLQPRLFGVDADHQRRERPARRQRRPALSRCAVRLDARRKPADARISSPSSSTAIRGFYFCAVVLIVVVLHRAAGSSARPSAWRCARIRSNQNRMGYVGFNTRPYALAAFVISGMYAGLAGSLLVVTDPLAGAERMQWTASGEVVLMTILGGAGTLVGPILGAGIIKYFENILSDHQRPDARSAVLVPAGPRARIVVARSSSLFVGGGWQLTLGVVFMLIVIFLPGGIMEGVRRLGRLLQPRRAGPSPSLQPRPAAGGVTDAAPSRQHRPARRRRSQELRRPARALRHRPARSRRARPARSSARTAPASRRCSTSASAGWRPIPAPSSSTAQTLTGKKPHEINQLGVARVFQTPEIFPDLTVLENVMIPALAKRDGAFRVRAWRDLGGERELRDKAPRR